MRIMRRSVVLGALLTSVGLLVPASGLAATATVTGTLSGTSLSLNTSAAPNFLYNLDNGDTPLPGQTYTVPAAVQDTRGNGSGWNLTVTSTQFTTGGATPNTLATGASSLTGVTSLCASGTCTNPTNPATPIVYPVSVPAATTAPTAVKFFNAAANSGMGKFTVTPTVAVFVPQNSFAGTYTSTLTLSIVTGP